jgi:hypothetical protein
MPHMFFNVRAPAIKWKTFHIKTLIKMLTSNKSIILDTCKWAGTDDVLQHLPAIHYIILGVHVHGPNGQDLLLLNMNSVSPE